MRNEYDFTNAIKNPYAKKLKKKISINLDEDLLEYFKMKATSTGIPYQTLIQLVLKQFKEENNDLHVSLK